MLRSAYVVGVVAERLEKTLITPFFCATKTWPSGAKRTAVGPVSPLKTTESVKAGSTTVAGAAVLPGVRMPGGFGLPAPAAPARARETPAAKAASAATPSRRGAGRGSYPGTFTIGYSLPTESDGVN